MPRTQAATIVQAGLDVARRGSPVVARAATAAPAATIAAEMLSGSSAVAVIRAWPTSSAASAEATSGSKDADTPSQTTTSTSVPRVVSHIASSLRWCRRPRSVTAAATGPASASTWSRGRAASSPQLPQ